MLPSCGLRTCTNTPVPWTVKISTKIFIGKNWDLEIHQCSNLMLSQLMSPYKRSWLMASFSNLSDARKKKIDEIKVSWHVKYMGRWPKWWHHQSPSFFKEYICWKFQLLPCVEVKNPDTPRSLEAEEIFDIPHWKNLEVKFF